MLTVIDYKMGNLHSVENALKKLGVECIISSCPEDIRKADKLILPGVGAFPDACKHLNEMGLFELIKDECKSGKPMLGICLGMQLLFSESYEFGKCEGLSLIDGKVIPITPTGLKIPHVGWNSLDLNIKDDKLMEGINDGDYVYFVHSFRADTSKDNIVASSFYGEEIPALVKAKDLNVWGVQFHPEKSHNSGLKILKNFCNL